MKPQFDEKDEVIRQRNLKKFNEVLGPRVGDWIIFADGVTRRISYIWFDEAVQTSSDGYGWHLQCGYCSFSGSLYNSVPRKTLTLTSEIRDGRVWFFHHDYAKAHNGVETTIPFRVFKCSEKAPS